MKKKSDKADTKSKGTAKRRKTRSKNRRLALLAALILLILGSAFSYLSVWYVHYPKKWIDNKSQEYPVFVTSSLESVGYPLADILDALDITGTDVVYEYDLEPPSGQVFFAGAPVRTGAPAPEDITIIDRGEFVIGWSPSLRRPSWVAYHVPREEKYAAPKRPDFKKDREAPNCPASASYTRSGYDRGHMAPNHAIATRFGPDAQKATFLMSNISPQSPQLNRGIWRDIEHRIADLWTAKYGEIWVIVGAITNEDKETISGTGIDVPGEFYQIVVAQQNMDVRAMAFLIPQSVSWREYPAKWLVSIDEVEEKSGFDFLSELDDFLERPLEAGLPSRVWPIMKIDVFKQLKIHFQDR